MKQTLAVASELSGSALREAIRSVAAHYILTGELALTLVDSDERVAGRYLVDTGDDLRAKMAALRVAVYQQH